MTESFPLSWPIGKKRTEKYRRRKDPFKTTMGKARDELLRQLRLLGASNIVISSNVATYHKGGKEIMYADQSAAKEDPAVAVYYTWKQSQYVLCCDIWDSVTGNLQALNKTVDAIRGINRWGTDDMMEAAFTGFKALPPKEEKKEQPKPPRWFEILGVRHNASIQEIKEAYRKKAMQHHPDRGGNDDNFHRIQKAYEIAIAINQNL